MPRTQLWCGLDVGADDMAVCCTDDQGNVIFEHSTPAKAAVLHALLRPEKRRIRLIGLEAGSCGTQLTRALRKLGYRVAVFDSRQVSKFLAIRRNKTDKNDAKGLADVGRLGQASVSEIRLKSPECQRLRSTLVTRQRLVRVRSSLEATMRSLFRLNGGHLKAASSAATLKRNVSNELARMRKTERIDLTEDVAPLLALSEATRSYLESLDKTLRVVAEETQLAADFWRSPELAHSAHCPFTLRSKTQRAFVAALTSDPIWEWSRGYASQVRTPLDSRSARWATL